MAKRKGKTNKSTVQRHYDKYYTTIFLNHKHGWGSNFAPPTDNSSDGNIEQEFDIKHDEEQAKEEQDKVSVDKNDEPDVVHDVSLRKFRRRMSKERQIKKVRSITKGALGVGAKVHNSFKIPGQRSMDEELYNDSIDEKDFVKRTIREYEPELKEVCSSDNNGDGKVDADDITPGMKRMRRYM